LLARATKIDEMLSKQYDFAMSHMVQARENTSMIREQNTHLIAVEEKIEAQEQTLWSILDKAKGGLVAILELQTMVGVIFRWVLE
jgi:hypothetical protein